MADAEEETFFVLGLEKEEFLGIREDATDLFVTCSGGRVESMRWGC